MDKLDLFYDKIIKSKTNTVLEQEKAKITTDKRDNDAPILIVDENITVNSSSYSFIVKAKDKGSEKIFIQVDGVTSEFKDGIFKIDRFSPVNEKITIVAIDQWGNKSKAKTVNIKVDIKDTIVAKKIEKLNPSKLKVKKSRNKVALIIGIEDYSQSPNATFANLDAKYFYEYASKGFGVKKEHYSNYPPLNQLGFYIASILGGDSILANIVSILLQVMG